MHAQAQLRGSRPSLATSRAFSLVFPMIREEREGGAAIKEPPPPSFTEASHFHLPKAKSLHLSPSTFFAFFRVLCNSRVLMGGSGIEAGIDWVNSPVPF